MKKTYGGRVEAIIFFWKKHAAQDGYSHFPINKHHEKHSNALKGIHERNVDIKVKLSGQVLKSDSEWFFRRLMMLILSSDCLLF